MTNTALFITLTPVFFSSQNTPNSASVKRSKMVIITNYEQMQIPPSMMGSKERPPQLKKPMKMNKLL
jgi:hypothetical protein